MGGYAMSLSRPIAVLTLFATTVVGVAIWMNMLS